MTTQVHMKTMPNNNCDSSRVSEVLCDRSVRYSKLPTSNEMELLAYPRELRRVDSNMYLTLHYCDDRLSNSRSSAGKVPPLRPPANGHHIADPPTPFTYMAKNHKKIQK